MEIIADESTRSTRLWLWCVWREEEKEKGTVGKNENIYEK